jgi:hypothetical protein
MTDPKYYRLSNFNRADVAAAKEFVKSAFLGYIETTLDETIDELFEKVESIAFRKVDTLIFKIEMEMLGNDFVAAISAVKLERKKRLKKDA